MGPTQSRSARPPDLQVRKRVDKRLDHLIMLNDHSRSETMHSIIYFMLDKDQTVFESDVKVRTSTDRSWNESVRPNLIVFGFGAAGRGGSRIVFG